MLSTTVAVLETAYSGASALLSLHQGSGATTVARALQVAGGITPRADIGRVQVSRADQVGVPQVLNIDLWQLLWSGDLRQAAILQKGDTVSAPTVVTADMINDVIVVNASLLANVDNTVGSVLGPLGRVIRSIFPLRLLNVFDWEEAR